MPRDASLSGIVSPGHPVASELGRGDALETLESLTHLAGFAETALPGNRTQMQFPPGDSGLTWSDQRPCSLA